MADGGRTGRAISFEHVAKRFQINRATQRTIMELVQRPFAGRGKKQFFWPLVDVSFEVPWGSAIGIIGENGTGKSTILKLISRILEPTTGHIEINGPVSALLELGVGFHPELTGRENIFLAASVANVSRKEIKRELDRVIDFSNIGSYIDMPVKHYSLGMYLRLGFAVAVHLRPQILLIDEVLAVGDESFQQKCLARISELLRDGTTVLLVSHNMEQVAHVCSSALWLHEGCIRSSGETQRVIDEYLSGVTTADQAKASGDGKEGGLSADLFRSGDGAVQVSDLRLIGPDGRPTNTFTTDRSMRIEIDYEVLRPVETYPAFGFGIYRSDGVWCYGTNTALDCIRLSDGELPDRGTVVVELPRLGLLQGSYSINLDIHAPAGFATHDHVRNAARFSVHSARGDQGVYRPELTWSLEAEQPEKTRA